MKRVAVIMGSDSDLPVVSGCAAKLDELGINYEMRVMSAHRTPADVAEFAQNAYKRDFGVIIAAAGKAAHLAGFIAANTTLPVIGIPIKASTFDGLDALLATVQMPSGVPVSSHAMPRSISSTCSSPSFKYSSFSAVISSSPRAEGVSVFAIETAFSS